MNAPAQPVDAAAVAASRDSLQTTLDALTTVIKGYSDVIAPEDADGIAGIRDDVVRLRSKLADDRLLRLGVVGQMKAGKSSLLNLLLFGGKEVLPKAATPMTASLTHITKSDRDEIEVEYYTKKDWAKIQKHAEEYQRIKTKKDGAPVPKFVRASYELVEMARKRDLQVGQYLDTSAVEDSPVSELNDKLTKLVGATGRLTPLVKSVTIRCTHGIPDLDIVDTPGINDPISSRSRRAEKMLVDCHAVLLLSYAGQFMDNADVEFFERRLPQEGISHRLIIGSKYDSALIDVAFDAGGDLQRARDETARHLATHASDAIQRLSEDDPRESVPNIIFISAMCSKLAATPCNRWDHEERSIFDRIRKGYPDYLDPAHESAGLTEETKVTLTELGNQTQVASYLDELRHNKHAVIFANNQKTVDEKYAATQEKVETLLESLRTYRTKINETEIELIDKQLKDTSKLRSRLTVMIKNKWGEIIKEELRKVPLPDLRQDLQKKRMDVRDSLKKSVEIIPKKKKTGLGPWIARVLWGGGWETYEQKVLRTSDVEGVIQILEDYINNELERLHSSMFDEYSFVSINYQKLTSIISNESSSDVAVNYDPDILAESLRKAVEAVAAEARATLRREDKFELEELSLESDDVEGGLDQARKVIGSAVDNAIKWVDRADDGLKKIARDAEDKLVPVALEFLTEYQKRLKKGIKDRAFVTSRIDNALREIEPYRSGLARL